MPPGDGLPDAKYRGDGDVVLEFALFESSDSNPENDPPERIFTLVFKGLRVEFLLAEEQPRRT